MKSPQLRILVTPDLHFCTKSKIANLSDKTAWYGRGNTVQKCLTFMNKSMFLGINDVK